MLSAPWYVWLSSAGVCIGLGTFVFLIAGQRPKLTPRQLIGGGRTASQRDIALNSSGLERLADRILDRLRDLGQRVTPAGVAAETDRRIARAGASDRWTADRFIAMKALLSLACFLVLFLYAVTTGRPLMVLLAAALVGVIFFVPDLVMVRRGIARDARMQNQLADIADQILIAVEAGASLDSAVARVSSVSDGPLQREFRRMLQDVSFGLSRKDALTAMASRTSVPELRDMLSALAQSEEHGLSVGNILRIQAGEIRAKRQHRAEEAALKVPVKLTLPLILCILPCLMAVILGPAVVRISQNLNF